MPKFAANLSFLWTELPFLDRFEAAARAGFRGVEFHYPYAFAAADIRARLDEFKLAPVLHNIAAGDAANGDFGLACVPAREDEFRTAVAAAIDYALQLGTPICNCLAGRVPANADRQLCEAILIDNLQYAGREFAKANLLLAVEPLNNIDVPQFLLNTSAHTIAILDQVGLPNVLLQYDLYHMQIMEGDLLATMRRLLPRIGHIQFADTPGRHEPNTGVIDFTSAFAAIDAMGYRGWVGAEYRPQVNTAHSLAWFKP